ncbi:hypothetical protein QYE76_034830 [Lolium multiflorum]|uniref:Uncharacterized protein n=1 Tax=Lolium multiflorum TaxID=4521 RepID=A0AAD8QZU5_LOLMU|nr:hypothetical protein QYE76_034830 [Lolium multiflorum]
MAAGWPRPESHKALVEMQLKDSPILRAATYHAQYRVLADDCCRAGDFGLSLLPVGEHNLCCMHLERVKKREDIRLGLIVRLDGNGGDENAEEGNSEEGNSEEGNAANGNAPNGNADEGTANEGNLDVLDDSDDSADSDFMDSDYDAADGDDDLFIDNVDLEVHDNNEHQDVDEIENDVTLIEDDDLQLTAEVEGHLQNKFKVFNAAVDMSNPEFKMGMTFSDVKELRNALQAYNIRNRFIFIR